MDPRLDSDPTKRKSPHSRLMQATLANKEGKVLNFCPFGCEGEDLDHMGYCDHLVGFTNDRKSYEPMEIQDGMRIVQLRRPLIETKTRRGKLVQREGPPILEPCLPGDKFEQITTSWRVYRDIDKQTPAVDDKAEKGTKATAKVGIGSSK